jgi:ribosome-associated translation inhibitor RaiA
VEVAPEVVLKDVPRTPLIERAIEEGIVQLEAVGDRITSCRVSVELPHRRRRSGNAYHVRIDVRLPGREILVSRPPSPTGPEEAHVAIAGAFDTARSRLLEDSAKRRAKRLRREDHPSETIAPSPSDEDGAF